MSFRITTVGARGLVLAVAAAAALATAAPAVAGHDSCRSVRPPVHRGGHVGVHLSYGHHGYAHGGHGHHGRVIVHHGRFRRHPGHVRHGFARGQHHVRRYGHLYPGRGHARVHGRFRRR